MTTYKSVFGLLTGLLLLAATTAGAQVANDIAKQNKLGNAVFLVVTEGGANATPLKDIAQKAKALYPHSAVLMMDKADPANAASVKRYGLSGAPMPMVLVVAQNGVVTEGFAKQDATPQKLVEGIPTPKQSEALLGFDLKKPVFVVMYKKSFTDKPAMIAACKKATDALKGKAVVVEVDLDDKAEAPFIALLNPAQPVKSTIVHVFNSKGDFSSKHALPVQTNTLVESAKKEVKECCPGGAKNCKK